MGSGREGRNQEDRAVVGPVAVLASMGSGHEGRNQLGDGTGQNLLGILPQWGPATRAGISAMWDVAAPTVLTMPQWGPATRAGISGGR